jgi:tetratricopeptide (TPR) repeat protein
MPSRFFPLFLVTAALILLIAASQLATSHSATSRYRECVALVDKDPKHALDNATAWFKINPTSPFARHCKALAMYNLKDYGGAADTLLSLSKEAGEQKSVLSVHLLSQAADAYKMGGQEDTAITVLSEKITSASLSPEAKAELLAKRGELYAAKKQPLKALKDANEALKLQPNNAAAKALAIDIKQKNGQ